MLVHTLQRHSRDRKAREGQGEKESASQTDEMVVKGRLSTAAGAPRDQQQGASTNLLQRRTAAAAGQILVSCPAGRCREEAR